MFAVPFAVPDVTLRSLVTWIWIKGPMPRASWWGAPEFAVSVGKDVHPPASVVFPQSVSLTAAVPPAVTAEVSNR